MFVKSTMRMTTLLVRSGTVLHHYEGNFIVVWLANGNGQPLQIARAKSDPNCNPEKPNCVMIQYFQPTSRSQHVQELYTGWDSEGGLH
jgi:hypothetical protein